MLATHPPSSAEVEGRVELYICSPSGPSWPVIGRTLALPLQIMYVKEIQHFNIPEMLKEHAAFRTGKQAYVTVYIYRIMITIDLGG